MMEAVRSWSRANRALTLAVWFNLGLLVFAAVAMPFDGRRILGLNPWIKPMKFDLSVVIYGFTVAVLLRLLGDAWRRMRRLIGGVVGVSMIVENFIISMQSFRGVRSHMNVGTLFDGVAFGIMGNLIGLNTAAVALLLAVWCLSRPDGLPRAIQWGVRLGLLAFLAGSIEGVVMIAHFAHTVGAKDGGPGLPFVNWSTSHGDLRVAHFFALHALQASILLGWGLSRTKWAESAQVATLSALYAGYMGLVWLLFREAMAGHPLLG